MKSSDAYKIEWTGTQEFPHVRRMKRLFLLDCQSVNFHGLAFLNQIFISGMLYQVYTISHLLSGNNGLKYPLMQLGLTIHNCTCDFSMIPDSGYTGSPSVKTPLTLS